MVELKCFLIEVDSNLVLMRTSFLCLFTMAKKCNCMDISSHLVLIQQFCKTNLLRQNLGVYGYVIVFVDFKTEDLIPFKCLNCYIYLSKSREPRIHRLEILVILKIIDEEQSINVVFKLYLQQCELVFLLQF